MISPLYEELEAAGREELGDYVDAVKHLATPAGVVMTLRFWLVTGDVLNVFASKAGRFAFHFEGRSTGAGTYHRDNAPHGSALTCPTFPRHCHRGSEDFITESRLPDPLQEALRGYCRLLVDFLEGT